MTTVAAKPAALDADSPRDAAVSFARKSGHTSAAGATSALILENGSFFPYLLIVCLIAAFVPLWVVVFVVPGLLVLFWICSVFSRHALGRVPERTPWEDVPELPNSKARVGCAGSPYSLESLERRGRIADEQFEPVIASCPGALPLSKWQVAAWIVIGLISIIAIATANQLLSGSWQIYGMFWVGVALGGWGMGALWPTYLRVSPGRLDVLRYSLLGRRVVQIVKHDLRTSAVLVDLNENCVFLVRDAVTTEIGIGAMNDKTEVAHAVLLGAVSTHEAAPLPDDALLG